jgi:hypothetical protein
LTPLFDDLVSQGVPNGFALQLCDVTTTNAQSGNMWLGGYDSAFTNGSMVYVPLTEQNYYSVAMSGFSIDGKSISGFSQFSEGTIVDSGTTLVMLKSSVGRLFKRYIPLSMMFIPRRTIKLCLLAYALVDSLPSLMVHRRIKLTSFGAASTRLCPSISFQSTLQRLFLCSLEIRLFLCQPAPS